MCLFCLCLLFVFYTFSVVVFYGWWCVLYVCFYMVLSFVLYCLLLVLLLFVFCCLFYRCLYYFHCFYIGSGVVYLVSSVVFYVFVCVCLCLLWLILFFIFLLFFQKGCKALYCLYVRCVLLLFSCFVYAFDIYFC